MIEPVIVQHMVAEAMGIDFTNVAVCIQQGWLQAVIAGAALVVGAVAQYQSNKAAKKAAKEQAELAKKQAAFNKKQGLQLYGDEGLYRQQASEALANTQEEYDINKEQIEFSWDQAQQSYDLNLSTLDHNRLRADESIDDQNLKNQAALGAFGVRGGSSRTKANKTIADARENLSFEYGQNKTQLNMSLESAQKQTELAQEQLDLGMQKAQQSYGYAIEQADMGKEAALKGYEFASEGISNQLQSVYDQANSWSVITAGLSGLQSGFQMASAVNTFGQQYLNDDDKVNFWKDWWA